ncbi:hypothetical protein Sjap_003454 [Stephania japonica]|uniref:S-locus receptor kinase n=1 Tax=Stephania japonica TaxID=461633 RepID=A0AAP0KQI8_9MAGN
MSPEYAMDGLFSIKSDVFSFGVIMLEIISGKKNKGFYHSNHNSNLLGNAWRLWRDGNPLELVDESIASSCVPSEVLRCIHVALLCVQHYPNDRLSMPLVSLMLISEATGLPTPKAPGFVRRNFHLTESSSSFHQESVTTNEMTISLLEPR